MHAETPAEATVGGNDAGGPVDERMLTIARKLIDSGRAEAACRLGLDGPGMYRRWRGGEGYATDLRFGGGLDQSLDWHWRVGALGRLWVTGYDEGDDETEPRGRSLDLQVSRRIGPGSFTVAGHLSRETPERTDLRWSSRGASVRYAASIGRDWNVSIRACTARAAKADVQECSR